MMKNIQNQFKLSITNKDLSKELDALGVNKGKSKNTGFPPFINESLYPHFIRGLWDGDGCFTGNKQNRFSASLFVNKKLSKDIQSIVRDKLGIRAHIKDAGCNKIVQLSITGNRQVLKFANYIYSKANFSLIRKFQIIERLLQYKLTLPNAGDFELVEEAATNFAQTRTKLETQL